MTAKKNDKSSWAIGGGVLMGIGIGFFFLRENPLVFVGCIMLGLGFGLMVTALISRKKEQG
jgi:F0F1-type ATP synthase assembly protein I